MREKIESIVGYLGHDLVEREEALKIALLGVFAGENVVLLGPPGTGKSLMARRIADVLEAGDSGEDYFEYLLTKFSTPEEIFGPLSIAELKADRFWRNTGKYLPTARLAFLDEIFKANSSILNSLLTILNERIYHNGSESQTVPLRSLIAASNEIPAEQDELAALYDRFLLRGFVDYVSSNGFARLFEEATDEQKPDVVTVQELESIEQGARQVRIPQEIVTAVSQIWQAHQETFKEDRRERLSDRRLKKVINLFKISAYTNDRTEVDLSDVFLLKNCLWSHPDNAIKVRKLVSEVLQYSSDVKSSESGDELAATKIIPELYETESVDGRPVGVKDAVVSGLRGQGTQNDPFLIETVMDLLQLDRRYVGAKGFYFRQISDIDCYQVNSWPDFDFQGYYDGSGFEILGNMDHLFGNVNEDSRITQLRLTGMSLALGITGSEVSYCTCNRDLICCTASESRFTAIVAQGSLVGMCGGEYFHYGINDDGHYPFDSNFCAIDCTIDRCQSGDVIIPYAKNCQLTDCLALYSENLSHSYDGGLVINLEMSSVVSRCMVSNAEGLKKASHNHGFFHFGLSQFHVKGSGGVAGRIVKSEIRNSVLAQCSSSPKKRIVNQCEDAQLINNAAIGLHHGDDDPNGRDGKTVDPKSFNLHFFETTLEWDFDKTWYWDNANRRPALRNIGCDDQYASDSNEPRIDLLTQQIRNNLWL